MFTKKKNNNARDYALLLSVPLLFYIVFFIVPNATTYVYSLFDYDGFGVNFEFIGLRNFVMLLSDRKFGMAFVNTIIYVVTVIIGQTTLGLLFAVLLVRQNRINNFFKAAFYLPTILSSVAVGFTWGFIFDPNLGVINTLLIKLGLASLQKSWLGDPGIVMFSIATVHIWQAVGTGMILLIAGLINISVELYEAAEVEGANSFQAFRHITLPLLAPVIVILIVLETVGCFKSFDYVWVLTGGGGDGSSNVIATWLFKQGILYNQVGYASAMAVILSITVSVIALVQINIFKDETM
ncbi:MAG: sugar ABC transporter permease [Oscillospiraceae bacterium]|nr:sugar ABC transporter permease [Oscillospiraceae bacterium]